ncbi:MAG: SoxR reducing system RseC family protein [Spirochaetes bacterium]|nr:SoxR reducing system RseC family protein [Spirochaetota bacterium]
MENYDTGIIEKIIDKNNVLVKVLTKGECSSCSSKEGCRITLFMDKNNLIEAKYNEELKIGDKVYIIINGVNRVISSLLVFAFPIISLIIFYIIGNLLFDKEILAILSSLTGLIIAFLIVYILLKYNKKFQNFKPSVTKIKN